MDWIQLVLISLALSIDCFTLSVCISSVSKLKKHEFGLIPLHFGFFHLIMIIIGYFVGNFFKTFIEGIDHWVAFILISSVGIKLIIESLNKNKKRTPKLTSEWKLLMISFATSIDALVIGMTFSFIMSTIYSAALTIGIIVFIVSSLGLLIGYKIKKLKITYLDLAAGIVLIGIGTNILLRHLL